MGKCVSKHSSALTIALSEKDLATANQIWSKFSESTEYIALKDEYGNQLCEYYYVSNSNSKKGDDDDRHKHGNQRQHHYHQQHDEDDEKATLPPRNENKSGQWTSEKIKYDDDNAVAVAKHIAGSGGRAKAAVAATTTGSCVGNSSYSRTGTNAIVNNSAHHKDAIDVAGEEEEESEGVCLLAQLCLQKQQGHQDNVDHFSTFATSDSNNNGHENISGVKNSKSNKNKNNKQKKTSKKLINYYSSNECEVIADDAPKTKWPKFSSAHQIDIDNNDNDCTRSTRTHELSFLQLCGNYEGQTESKKSAKKHAANAAVSVGAGGVGIETKGTAMSFGFRKKLNTTPKKLRKLIEGSSGDTKKKQQQQEKYNNIRNDNLGGVYEEGETFNGTGAVIDTDEGDGVGRAKDNNGNAELMPNIHFEKMGAAGKTLSAAVAAQQKMLLLSHQGVSSTEQAQNHRPGVGNRFGYRGTGNIVRPASTGITPTRYQNNDAHENAENNNGNVGGSGGGDASGTGADCGGLQQKILVSNLKRRSKSAHAGRALTSNKSGGDGDDETEATATPKIAQPKTIKFNLNQNSTIEYQRRQFFQQPTSNASGRAWPQQQQHQQQQQQQQQQQYQYQQQLQQQHKNIVNSSMHTNVIVRPTPRAALQPTTTATATTYSKFTLHTVSLPKPEFPVAISLNATTPTTPVGGIILSSPVTTVVDAVSVTGGGARAKDQQQHPLTVAQSTTQQQLQTTHMDLKTAKQMANNTRRGFSGSREISADSGIASMDMALDSSTSSGGGGGGGSHANGRHSSPKRSRSRPRNLQMVMSGRHKFEVRDLDTDQLSSESSSIVETLALPKLPSEENKTIPLPLSGLVRSNTVLSRESYERKNATAAASAVEEQQRVQLDKNKTELPTGGRIALARNPSEESESIDEEKLYLDRSTSEKSAKQHHFRDINTCSSKTSSPGSSIMLSWCNAGESLAVKDCSSLSISSSEDSNKVQGKLTADDEHKKSQLDSNDDDLSLINTDMQCSTISSITEAALTPNPNNVHDHSNLNEQKLKEKENHSHTHKAPDRPKSLYNTLNESKFAEMALEGSTYLLDDETSPTDSLVSSTESEDAAAAAAGCKQKKHKLNEELQEKDIDEISPELEVGSPISPGTPTHASHSLSLSDCGNLIDDEIADQPALLFNSDTQDGGCAGCDGGGGFDSLASHKEKTDTPTLMETAGGSSMRSLKSQSKARTALQQAIELSLRTPLSLRKAVMERAESLDTLSPCESICSDDLMMDFDINSSIDSIDRSIKSRSGSDLNKIDETQLFSELERKGSGVMKELNTILRIHTNRNPDKDSVIAHLPARATRLLNRSRLQQQCPLVDKSLIAAADSDSSKSTHSLRRSAAASRASTGTSTSTHTASAASSHSRQRPSSHQHHQPQHHQNLAQSLHGSSDDLMLYDKSFRNAMIQDVLQFKRQLLRLRRILQEDEDCLMRTETLNPFENDNGQLFASCGLDSKLLDDIDLASLTSSITDDPMQELADLRRQVVYLQGQVDDRDRTIRLQRNLIEKLEAEKCATSATTTTSSMAKCDAAKECINIATQTERTRPLAIGPEGLSRSKPEYTSYTTTHYPTLCSSSSDTSTTIIKHQQYPPNNQAATTNQTRRHTIISTTLTNYNHQLQLAPQRRRASIAWEKETPAAAMNTKAAPITTYKPVKITLIGEPLPQSQWLKNGSKNGDAMDMKNMNLVNGNDSGSVDGGGINDLVNGNKQNGLKNIVNGVRNGHHHHDIKNDDDNVYLRLENMTTAHHHHQHHHHHQYYNNNHHHQIPKQKDNKIYQMPAHTHTNGNLNPTVTIV